MTDQSVWDLRNLTTQWSKIDDMDVFVLRYVDPIRMYLERLLDEDAVEDVLQQFLVKVLERRFANVSRDRGRFRHYLIRAVRNEATTWHRVNKTRATQHLSEDGDAVPTDESDTIDDVWNDSWRETIVNRARMEVDAYEEAHDGCLYGTILSVVGDADGTPSPGLAAEVSTIAGREIAPATFRQQLSRARKMFAESILKEVAETLDRPRPEDVQEELVELGLWNVIAKHVPDGWLSTA